jgi:hypothetical protein
MGIAFARSVPGLEAKSCASDLAALDRESAELKALERPTAVERGDPLVAMIRERFTPGLHARRLALEQRRRMIYMRFTCLTAIASLEASRHEPLDGGQPLNRAWIVS